VTGGVVGSKGFNIVNIVIIGSLTKFYDRIGSAFLGVFLDDPLPFFNQKVTFERAELKTLKLFSIQIQA
jgi:hypothetical protein